MFEVELASRGGAPLFQPYHILKALWHLYTARQIGRKELSLKLGIGEGSARKLIAHLETEDCATSSKQHGIVLTAFGRKKVDSLGLVGAYVKAGPLTVGTVDYGVRLTGLAETVTHGVEQRDEAIKVGADGATTLVFFRDELRMPDGFDVEGAEPDIARKLTDTFELVEGDALFIGSGGTPEAAMDGAFAAAVWTLKK